MANSLRAKISKLRHDRNITEEEYQELISKLDGHDKQIYLDGFHKGVLEETKERLAVMKEFENEVRTEVIDECADKFADILSNMKNVCGINCPVKCNWGTEETCEDMCKKWFKEQFKEQNNE